MTVASYDEKWLESYQRVFTLLPSLTKKELDIIGDVANQFAVHADTEFRHFTEQELTNLIDTAVKHADEGRTYTLEETLSLVDKEFGLFISKTN